MILTFKSGLDKNGVSTVLHQPISSKTWPTQDHVRKHLRILTPSATMAISESKCLFVRLKKKGLIQTIFLWVRKWSSSSLSIILLDSEECRGLFSGENLVFDARNQGCFVEPTKNETGWYIYDAKVETAESTSIITRNAGVVRQLKQF